MDPPSREEPVDVLLERRAAERIITLGLVVYTFRNILGNERLSIDFHLIPYFGEHSSSCLEVFPLEFLVDGLSVV